jgi:hypothetical protein
MTAGPTDVSGKLRDGRPRTGVAKGFQKGTKPRYGVWPEDSKTYKKDEATVQGLINTQDKLEQQHDKKQGKE